LTRLASALNSEDLKHHPHDCDADVLQATGLAGIRRNLGVLILEAKEGCAGESGHSVARIKDLEEALKTQIKRLGRRWRVDVDVRGVASKVVRELILDRCGVCQGRGFIPMKYDGTRLVVVSSDLDGTAKDVECSVCLGSGSAKRDYHGRAKAAGWPDYSKRLGEWWEAVLQSCCDAEINARADIWKRLALNKKSV
jgi:hypothetical protein